MAGLIAVIVGLLAGMLTRRDGKRFSVCIAIGAATFGGTLTLLLDVFDSLKTTS